MIKNYLKIGLFFTTASIFSLISAQAKEGMWLPSLLKKQAQELKDAGLKISVDEIYHDDAPSFNDAVVIFGGGCTGEIVSPHGLLFTNHHCGYGTVQSLSTEVNNYLTEGFWAKNNAEEIPCPGLKVTFVRKMENVSHLILKNLGSEFTPAQKEEEIAKRIKQVTAAYTKITGYEAEVKPFYHGNEYWISLKEVFSDVRLVGNPPNGIGKFGGDTDNWMWPRQTGDFAVFRVYANKQNQPAEYDIANKPYQPKKFFPINISGYKEGDFTMVYGFPYTTSEYISSYQLNQIQHITDPIRIESRRKKLGVWDEAMRQDPGVFLKYASKQSSISNGFKKWQGEVKGLSINNVIDKKQSYENAFQKVAINDHKDTSAKMILSYIQAAVNGIDQTVMASEYLRESVMGIEIVQQSVNLSQILNALRLSDEGEKRNIIDKSVSKLKDFYKNYDIHLDKKLFTTLVPYYMEQESFIVPSSFKQLYYENGNNVNTWANSVYGTSILASPDALFSLLNEISSSDSMIIKEDPAFIIYQTLQTYNQNSLIPELEKYNANIQPLMTHYMRKQMEYNIAQKEFYPDANQTLRLTYGMIDGIQPIGSDNYSFQTNLDQIVDRYNPAIEEFNVPEKLRQIHAAKDYGKWAQNGTVPVNFIASNHTSGGNSGSPVLNAKGELIGINFDRIWDGTMSDLYFDPKLCRNISVDIRYVLFIIEKYGEANWLFKEMKLVK